MLFYLIAFKIFTSVCICAQFLRFLFWDKNQRFFFSFILALSNMPRCLCPVIGSMVKIWRVFGNNSSALNNSIISAFWARRLTLINTFVKMERGSWTCTDLSKEHGLGMTTASFCLTFCNECFLRWNSLTWLWSFVMLSILAIRSSQISSDAFKRYFFYSKGIQTFNTESILMM